MAPKAKVEGGKGRKRNYVEDTSKYIMRALILEKLPPEEGNEVLLSLLQKSPQPSNVRPRNGGHSMRKFKKVEEQVTRPGYSSDSQFVCRHCGKRYRWKSTMRRHEQVECGGKEPRYRCPICPYRAKQKGNLGVHLLEVSVAYSQLEFARNLGRHFPTLLAQPPEVHL
ncbi:hypothetical protein ILUMI_21725, partial [Ignelater luminosus]